LDSPFGCWEVDRPQLQGGCLTDVFRLRYVSVTPSALVREVRCRVGMEITRRQSVDAEVMAEAGGAWTRLALLMLVCVIALAFLAVSMGPPLGSTSNDAGHVWGTLGTDQRADYGTVVGKVAPLRADVSSAPKE